MGLKYPHLGWILVVAFALRFMFGMLLLPDRLDPRHDGWAFAYEQGSVARSLAGGHGFSDPYFEPTGPTALVPPVFPVLLAGIFKIFGVYTRASAIAALCMNCIFSAFTAVPLYLVAKKAFSARAAIWCGWVWAVFPYSVYMAAAVPWVITLTTLLCTTLVLLAMRLEHSGRVQEWLEFGLLAGITALIDPVSLSIIPVIIGWICFRRIQRRETWARAAIIAVTAIAVVLAPWAIRNGMVFHRAVFLRDGFWLEFHVGNSGHPLHWWDPNAHPSKSPPELHEMARLGELGYMDAKRQESLAFLQGHPGAFVVLVFRRIIYFWTGFWSLNPEYMKMEPFDLYNVPLCTALTALTVLGLLRMFRECHFLRWLFLPMLLLFPSVYYITHPLLRYRGPIDPEVIMLTVYAFAPRGDIRGRQLQSDQDPEVSVS